MLASSVHPCYCCATPASPLQVKRPLADGEGRDTRGCDSDEQPQHQQQQHQQPQQHTGRVGEDPSYPTKAGSTGDDDPPYRRPGDSSGADDPRPVTFRGQYRKITADRRVNNNNKHWRTQRGPPGHGFSIDRFFIFIYPIYEFGPFSKNNRPAKSA